MAQSSDAAPEIAGSLGAWASLVMACSYAAVALIAAALLERRTLDLKREQCPQESQSRSDRVPKSVTWPGVRLHPQQPR